MAGGARVITLHLLAHDVVPLEGLCPACWNPALLHATVWVAALELGVSVHERTWCCDCGWR